VIRSGPPFVERFRGAMSDVALLAVVAAVVASGCSTPRDECTVDCIDSFPPIVVHSDGIVPVGDNFVLLVSDPAGSTPTSHTCSVVSLGGGSSCLQCKDLSTSCPSGIFMRTTNAFTLSAQDTAGAPMGSQTFTPQVLHSDCCGDIVTYEPSTFTLR